MSDSLSETDPDLFLLWTYGCAVAVDLDHGIDRRTALEKHSQLVVSAFDVDRIRIKALAARARARVRQDADDAWREAAQLAETALAMLGDQPDDTESAGR